MSGDIAVHPPAREATISLRWQRMRKADEYGSLRGVHLIARIRHTAAPDCPAHGSNFKPVATVNSRKYLTYSRCPAEYC